MGRILFLSAVAYLAYRYIGSSNKKHEQIAAQDLIARIVNAETGSIEVLAPAAEPSVAVAPNSELRT